MRVSPSPSLLLTFWTEMAPGVTSLFSCSPPGSVDIPPSMMKTTPNSLSRSLRQSMSLTLHTGMTSQSLVSSYSLNLNATSMHAPVPIACIPPGHEMHPPSCAEILLTEHQWERAFLLAQILMGVCFCSRQIRYVSHTKSTKT